MKTSAFHLGIMCSSMGLLISPPLAAAAWYVDGSVSVSGDGKSWESALKTIQRGIDAASDGDTVIVGEGTYVENIHFHGKNIVLRSTDPLNPTIVKETIIDGAQSGSVVTFAGTEDETCVLSGFTIRNGMSDVGAGILGGASGNHTHATIQNNRIAGNSATWGGGLLRCNGYIANNAITGNSAGMYGGGVGLSDGAIHNNVIAANSANFGGGLALCAGTIENNTITGNSAIEGGGVHHSFGTICNCIIWGNSAQGHPQLSGSSLPVYSCIQGGTGGGEGNTDQDPIFVDPDGPDDDIQTCEDNNYRLSPGSPCIDAGKNENWMHEAVDLDGNPRIWPGKDSWTVDMGAYEYGSFPFGIVKVIETAGGQVMLAWNSRPEDTYRVYSCTDLIRGLWIYQATIPSHGEGTTWSDPATSSPCKFYKIEIE